jgi:hypothetical protein
LVGIGHPDVSPLDFLEPGIPFRMSTLTPDHTNLNQENKQQHFPHPNASRGVFVVQPRGGKSELITHAISKICRKLWFPWGEHSKSQPWAKCFVMNGLERALVCEEWARLGIHHPFAQSLIFDCC